MRATHATSYWLLVNKNTHTQWKRELLYICLTQIISSQQMCMRHVSWRRHLALLCMRHGSCQRHRASLSTTDRSADVRHSSAAGQDYGCVMGHVSAPWQAQGCQFRKGYW